LIGKVGLPLMICWGRRLSGPRMHSLERLCYQRVWPMEFATGTASLGTPGACEGTLASRQSSMAPALGECFS
jgi:hypothetical protein